MPVSADTRLVVPLRRAEDAALATLSELALVLLYLGTLVVKTCDAARAACTPYGFGDRPDGAAAPIPPKFKRIWAHFVPHLSRRLPLLPVLWIGDSAASTDLRGSGS
eukprot:3694385-Prymnesium_polylepis.1